MTGDNDKPRGGGYFLETSIALDICDFHSFQDVPMQYFPSESLSWRLEGASFLLNSDYRGSAPSAQTQCSYYPVISF